uniref:Uncharacterized protein n=1 Tax=Timema bartmani TaxID=61472 RepID=A0A7R9I126_9NEOP|nr:unnamed protein product [Timema bartmani]
MSLQLGAVFRYLAYSLYGVRNSRVHCRTYEIQEINHKANDKMSGPFWQSHWLPATELHPFRNKNEVFKSHERTRMNKDPRITVSYYPFELYAYILITLMGLKVEFRESVSKLAWREYEKPFRKSHSSKPDRYSNSILPVIGSLVYCESHGLDHVATEVDSTIIQNLKKKRVEKPRKKWSPEDMKNAIEVVKSKEGPQRGRPAEKAAIVILSQFKAKIEESVLSKVPKDSISVKRNLLQQPKLKVLSSDDKPQCSKNLEQKKHGSVPYKKQHSSLEDLSELFLVANHKVHNFLENVFCERETALIKINPGTVTSGREANETFTGRIWRVVENA